MIFDDDEVGPRASPRIGRREKPVGRRRTGKRDPKHPAPSTGVKAMYILTLTADERRAFDWVGDRYNSGKVADLLLDCMPEDREWGDDDDITLNIPEHVAWEIDELADAEDYSWACFSPSLAAKLNDLCQGIV
jgi:hypothetical protein